MWTWAVSPLSSPEQVLKSRQFRPGCRVLSQWLTARFREGWLSNPERMGYCFPARIRWPRRLSFPSNTLKKVHFDAFRSVLLRSRSTWWSQWRRTTRLCCRKVLEHLEILTIRAQHSWMGYVVEVNDTTELHIIIISLRVNVIWSRKHEEDSDLRTMMPTWWRCASKSPSQMYKYHQNLAYQRGPNVFLGGAQAQQWAKIRVVNLQCTTWGHDRRRRHPCP